MNSTVKPENSNHIIDEQLRQPIGDMALCRCCQNSSCENLRPLSSHYRRLLLYCTQLTVDEDTHLPPYICINCLNTLKISYNFQKKCETSYGFLMKQIQKTKSESDVSVKDEIVHFPSELHEYSENDDMNYETSNVISTHNNFEIENGKKASDESNFLQLKETQDNNKIRVDMKKHGYYITADDVKFGMEPEYLEALNKIYKHRCNHCSRIYAIESNFKVHVNSHLGIRPYFCELCKKHFSDERSHIKYHKQRKEKGTFKCQYCERAYNCAGSLRTHMKVHTGDIKWFACSQCPKKFNQINKLNNHMVVHTNDRNFICQYCSKAFRFNRNLRAHIVSIHVNNRSHICDTCTKAFSTAHELTLHKRRHLGIKKHNCNYCTLSFVSSSELQRHVSSVHTKSKNFACRRCGARFTRSTHRNNHEGSKRCITNMSKNINNIKGSELVAVAADASEYLNDFTKTDK